MTKVTFPNIITALPKADIPVDGLEAFLLQSENQQVVFMNFEKNAKIPEHSHEAQWGIVLDGQIDLTVNGKTYSYKRGDTYFIPKDVKHSAIIKKGYKDVTIFNQVDRYKIKHS